MHWRVCSKELWLDAGGTHWNAITHLLIPACRGKDVFVYLLILGNEVKIEKGPKLERLLLSSRKDLSRNIIICGGSIETAVIQKFYCEDCNPWLITAGNISAFVYLDPSINLHILHIFRFLLEPRMNTAGCKRVTAPSSTLSIRAGVSSNVALYDLL